MMCAIVGLYAATVTLVLCLVVARLLDTNQRNAWLEDEYERLRSQRRKQPTFRDFDRLDEIKGGEK